MKVCVMGLWHLGTVTAACLAAAGHQVLGLDFDEETIRNLQKGQPPIFEPGLEELVQRELKSGRLAFTAEAASPWKEAEIVWITYDTPVDDDDRADVEFVVAQIKKLFPYLAPHTLILISSQLPVGTTRRLETECADKTISFAYSPENLRLGKAIEVFTKPDRVIIGIRRDTDRERLAQLFQPLTERLEWMSVESAEMTKHALNAFLATSVTFINEIAVLCEQVGADAKEVERGLKSEQRIGPKAYLMPGASFAGGTLARDINFLMQLGTQTHQATHLLSAVRASNEAHKFWARHKLQALLGDLRDQTIAIWGLTYKAGTDTLRRSSAIELCEWLLAQQARVRVHDPVVWSLPGELSSHVIVCSSALEALAGASALVVATEWKDYLDIDSTLVAAALHAPNVLDANRFLLKTLGADEHLRYFTVGKPL